MPNTLTKAENFDGRILGYTVIGLDETPAGFDVTNAMLPVHDDLKVSFTFPEPVDRDPKCISEGGWLSSKHRGKFSVVHDVFSVM